MFSFIKRKITEYNRSVLFVVTALTASGSASVPVLASEPSSPGANTLQGFLATASTVFQWIIEEMGNLIDFIMGNPFLQVGLVLFIIGAVVAFFVRIKMSV